MTTMILCMALALSCGRDQDGGLPSSGFVVGTLVGDGTPGSMDGNGTAAQLNQPDGVTVSPSGTIWMTDSGNNSIRSVTPMGQIRTIGNTSGTPGSNNGPAASATFDNPDGIATDSSGNVYVADTGNNQIRKIDSSNNVSTIAGTTTAGAANGAGTAATFDAPAGIALDPSTGNIYVADENNHCVRQIDTAGNVTTIVGGVQGDSDGTGTAAKLNRPHGMTIDSEGNLYISEKGNHKIKKIHRGSRRVETLAGSGSPGNAIGIGNGASFNEPHGLAVDKTGNVFVADEVNNQIKQITSSGVVITVAGAGPASFADGIGSSAKFNAPRGVAMDSSGAILICDFTNNRIRKITH